MTRRVVPWPILRIHRPFTGMYTMLELGAALNPSGRSYQSYYESIGLLCKSATFADLKDRDIGTFDMVSNVGASEVVEDQESVWRMLCDATVQTLVCMTSLPDSSSGGQARPTTGFYYALARENGFGVMRIYRYADRRRTMICVRMTRIAPKAEFKMPPVHLIHGPERVLTVPERKPVGAQA